MANNLKENVKFYKSWDYNIKAAGVKFYQTELAQLYRKDWEDIDIELVLEPENKYDPNAIKIIADGLHVGYVPALIAQVMAKQLADGAQFDIEVVYITGNDGTKSHTIKIALNRR